MHAAVEPLLHHPDFLDLLQELNRAWEDEQQRRRKFREELTPEMKAEFIEGQVFMHSPAMARHILAAKHLAKLLDTWVVEHDLGLVTIEKALVCLTRNDFEPDIAFFKGFRASSIQPTLMEFPAPDFVVEVLSPSTEATDRGIKMRDYARHGVAEYWLVDCKAQVVERYELDASARAYTLAGKHGTDSEAASSVIQGFSIPVAAIFEEKAQHEALRRMLSQGE